MCQTAQEWVVDASAPAALSCEKAGPGRCRFPPTAGVRPIAASSAVSAPAPPERGLHCHNQQSWPPSWALKNFPLCSCTASPHRPHRPIRDAVHTENHWISHPFISAFTAHTASASLQGAALEGVMGKACLRRCGPPLRLLRSRPASPLRSTQNTQTVENPEDRTRGSDFEAFAP